MESLSKIAERRLHPPITDHPNICQLYDIGSQDGADYLVMEFLEGENLAERLRKGALPNKDALMRMWRCFSSGEEERCEARTFTATVRSNRVSLARYTSPMPPAPSGDWIS
jgi:serine/threonine protein kinase